MSQRDLNTGSAPRRQSGAEQRGVGQGGTSSTQPQPPLGDTALPQAGSSTRHLPQHQHRRSCALLRHTVTQDRLTPRLLPAQLALLLRWEQQSSREEFNSSLLQERGRGCVQFTIRRGSALPTGAEAASCPLLPAQLRSRGDAGKEESCVTSRRKRTVRLRLPRPGL